MQLPSLYTTSCLEFISAMFLDALPVIDFKEQLSGLVAANFQADCLDPALCFKFLPSIICNTLSPKDVDKAIPITVAWQFIQLAAKIFDDIEDGAIRKNIPGRINLATGCIFAAQCALANLDKYDVCPETASRVMKNLSESCLRACAGQQADLSATFGNPIPDPDSWLEIAALKSGELFSWAAWAGAVIAGENLEAQSKFQAFGRHLGIEIQIADDFSGLWGEGEPVDLSQEKSGLPLCYARLVASEQEKETLDDCLTEASLGNFSSTKASVALITGLGGQSYLFTSAWLERQKGARLLDGLSLVDNQKEELLELFAIAFPALAPTLPYDSQKQFYFDRS